MLSSKFALEQARSFVADMAINSEVKLSKAILFGSMVKGNFHKDSDIDLALWSVDFCGSVPFDIEKFVKIKQKYPLIEVHTFEENDTASENPFIEEIMKNGLEIL